MGDRAGGYRLAKGLARKARVLRKELLAPRIAQTGTAGRRRIGVDVFRLEAGHALLNRIEVHRPATFSRNPDGRVEAMRLRLRFGGLREDALWKVCAPTVVGEHRENFGGVLRELFIELTCQWIDGLLCGGVGLAHGAFLGRGALDSAGKPTSADATRP